MSLTSHLDDKASPVRQFIDSCSPIIVEASGNSARARAAKKALAIDDTADQRLVVPIAQGANPGTIGAAFDYWVRFGLAPADVRRTVGAAGATALNALAARGEDDLAPAGSASISLLADLQEFLDSRKPYQAPLAAQEQMSLARYCVALALLESVFRAGPFVLSGSLGELLRSVDSAPRLLAAVGDASTSNVLELALASQEILTSWRNRIASGEVYAANPVFSGSAAVGGADADWVIGSELVEMKTTSKLTAAGIREALRQVVGYVLLDFEDAYSIRNVTVFYPRFSYTRTWAVVSLIGGGREGTGEASLDDLRAAMRDLCERLPGNRRTEP